jgi:hypothetical protein
VGSGESSTRNDLGRTHALKFCLPMTTCMFWAKIVEQPPRIKILPFNKVIINDRCFNRQVKYTTCHFIDKSIRK